jgi:lipopolysaccharide export system permease protein
MRLLDRYLLRELLVPLMFCLSGILIIWTAFDLITELHKLQERDLLFGDIAQYYLVQIPSMLVLILPIALLLALLYSLTTHARHHEISAIRAAGVSLWRLSAPYFAVGFVASVALLALNEFVVPDSAEAAEAIRNRRQPPAAPSSEVRNHGFANSRADRLWISGVYDQKTGDMIQPWVIEKRTDGSLQWLYAERAARKNGVWTFYKARLFKDPAQVDAPMIPVLITDVLACPQFAETPEQIQSEVRISEGMSLRAAKKSDVPIRQILNYLRLNPNPADSAWLYTKLHGRLAAPWTCLVVVLIALPFGAASGRRNVFVGVASSLFICFVYFVLQQVCLAMGTGGYVPAWLAGWFPNIAFGITGLWLTARVR